MVSVCVCVGTHTHTQNLGCLNRLIFKNGKDRIPALSVRSELQEKLGVYLGRL